MKKENLKQRAYLNSVTTMIEYSARVVIGFIVTPFLVIGLGSKFFGIWKILEQISSYTSMADIRATEVLKWSVAKERETASEEALRCYLTTTFILVVAIVPLLLIAAAIIIYYVPTLTRIGPEYSMMVQIASSLLILSLIINKVFDVFGATIRGMNIGYKMMGIRAIILVIGGGLQIIVVAVLEYGLIGLALVQVLISLMVGTTLYYVAKKHVPWFGFGKVDLKQSRDFLKISGWFMGWSGTKILLANSDKIILGYFSGPTLVAQYAITQYVAKAMQGITTSTIHGALPGIGSLYGKGEYVKLLQVRSHIFALTWLLSVSIGFVILAFNKSFVELWAGENLFLNQTSNLLIIIMIAQYMFIQNDSAIINITLELKQKVLLGFLAALISIGVSSFLLINGYGVVGLCSGFIVGRSLLSISYPIIIKKKTKIEKHPSSLSPFAFALSITVLMIGFVLGEKIFIDSWLLLSTALVVSLMAIIPLLFVLCLKKDQQEAIRHYISNIKFFNIK